MVWANTVLLKHLSFADHVRVNVAWEVTRVIHACSHAYTRAPQESQFDRTARKISPAVPCAPIPPHSQRVNPY